MQLEQRRKSLLVATLCALHQVALGIISFGFEPGWDEIGCCRGNYACGHFSLLAIEQGWLLLLAETQSILSVELESN